MVAGVVAHVGKLLAVAVADQRVAREGRAVQAADRGKAVEEGLGVGVDREAEHQDHGEKDAQTAEQRNPSVMLSYRRPAGMDSRPWLVPALRLDLLRNVSTHRLEAHRV